MKIRSLSVRLTLASVVVFAACHDADVPLEPDLPQPAAGFVPHAPGQLAEWFDSASPDVLEIPRTVFMDHDEATGQLVIGIENQGIARAVENTLARHGIPSSAYRLRVTPPIVQAATLRDAFRPTRGGTQIHFSSWLCTLGFNVSHSGGRSFITNSHCTDQQGGTEGTEYYQPLSSVNGAVIGVEADDPQYTRCSFGKVCRSSDAARALYNSGTESTQGGIARTSGANNGSLEVTGSFTITEQENSATSFSGPIHKVGRTTGWTSGTATFTCVNVNVSGTNIQQQCQTLVENPNATIVSGGDSGSPVFVPLGNGDVRLVGILWGGSTDNHLFVFSPLNNIQDELGSMTATASGGGDGGGGGNNPPTASFTFSCTELSCSFNGSGSSDSDGTIGTYSWNFGDGNTGSGATTSHTYAAGGDYTVTLTVTDDDDATDAASQQVTVSSGGSSDPITLTATGTKVRGTKSADLSWSGATSTNVDVRRDGSVVATTANDGGYTDVIGKGGGSHTYQICEAGTSTCSNTVTVNFN
jgi:PKD repeat protein